MTTCWRRSGTAAFSTSSGAVSRRFLLWRVLPRVGVRVKTPSEHSAASSASVPEELVAELGAAFLCADLELALEPREDHASYIATWLRVLAADNRAVFTAAAHAQRATEFINSRATTAVQVNSTCA